MAATTQYSENAILSLNTLAIKNKELEAMIVSALDGSVPMDTIFEKYQIETEFGDKIVKASVVSPDFSRIISRSVKDLIARVEENIVAMKQITKAQPAYNISEADANVLKSDLEYMALYEPLFDANGLPVLDSQGKYIYVLKEGA